MKKIYSLSIGLLMLAGFVVSAPHAYAAFNDSSLGHDCPTIGAATITTSQSDGCDPTSVSTTPGSVINVSFYIHNTSINTAHNVILRLSPQTTGSVTSQTYAGSITSSDGGSVSGSSTINISSPASLTFMTVEATDHNGNVTQVPNGSALFSGGLNIGDVLGYGTCPTVGGSRDVFCHQGWIVASFKVGSAVVSNPCTIQSFTSSAGTGQISSGSSATLMWNAPNCTNFTLTGGIFNGSSSVTSGVNTGPLTATTSYTLNATGSDGSHSQSSTTVSVANVAPQCVITNFSTSTPSVISGSYGTLNWNSSGCSTLTVSGPNGTVSTNANGPATVGPLTASSNVYSIFGTNSAGVSATAPQVVITVASAAQCAITGFTPSQTQVSSGSTVMLSWTTNNCTSMTVTGSNVSYSTSTLSQVLSGSTYTGGVFGPTTYTMTATNGTNTATATTSVSTTSSNYCTASLTASQTQVPSGSTATLNWYSTGCTYLTISGPTGTLATNLSGSIQTPPIYGTTVFNLVAGGTNNVNQSVTISTNANGTVPVVTTNAATNISTTSATLNGYISANTACVYPYYNCTNNNYSTYYFQYGTSQYSMNNQTPSQTMSGTAGGVLSYVSNLQPNTTYYFQLIGSNTFGLGYGGILSFTTNGGNISAITTIATNITSNSARLNGIVTAPQGTTGVTAHFEYGTSTALGLRTNDQVVAGNVVTNYFDTINTSPNTTYYFRIVGNANGQVFPGSIVPFTTPGVDNGGPVIITRVVGTGGGSAFVSLSIDDATQSVGPGDFLVYTINYQNISGVNLNNATLNVILPTGVTFRQSSQGVLTTSNNVTAVLGTLTPGQQGVITIQAIADASVLTGNNLLATATLAFTTPSKAQDTAIAYDLDSIRSNNLGGLALFGTGFWPNSLLGWIILLLLILILILIARYFYHRANAAKIAAQPVTHVHYDNAPGGRGPVNNNGYPNSNLPH